MNAARETYGFDNIDDKLRKAGEYTDAAKTCDGIIYATIVANKNHRLRRAFATEIDATSGEIIHDEPLGSVQIVTDDGTVEGCEVEPDYIQTLLKKKATALNADGVTGDQGFYSWQGTKLFYTGASCKIDVIPATAPAFPMTPLEYELGVVSGMNALLFPKEGQYPEAAAHFQTMWAKILDLIAMGKEASTFPELAFQRVP